jgi:hypothetical protein
MSDQAVAANFLAYASNRMRDTHRTLTVCLDRLTEEQIWHRGADHENAIGNLLLHLDGNIRQWILHGIDGQPDVRQRDDEFTLAPAISSIEARDRLAATLEEACTVIAKVCGHLEMHTGQVILLTKQMVGKDLDLTMPRKR